MNIYYIEFDQYDEDDMSHRRLNFFIKQIMY